MENVAPKINAIVEDKGRGVFEIEPLAPGYGYTIGNSLRRVLLSSLSGSAITSVKIDGVTHEFATVPHIKEDVLEMVLNIKDIKVKNLSDEPQVIKLSTKIAGEVTAAQIEKNAQVEIINPEQKIATLDKGGQLNIEMVVENGRGFYPTEDREKSSEFGVIAVDAVFTPVKAVNYHVENTRVGQMTNFNKLVVEIITDGAKDPKDALYESIDGLIDYFSALKTGTVSEVVEEIQESDIDPLENSSDTDPKTKITDLGLSSRTVNALLNNGIKTIGGLKRLSDLKLSEIKGLGSKGFDEIKKILGR